MLRPSRTALAAALFATLASATVLAAPAYTVSDLPAYGGTRNQANSIADRGWIAGFTTRPADLHRHATVWMSGMPQDLQTLGGPNSSVAWPVKANDGLVVGISQTATPELLGEAWSCAGFFQVDTTGYVCRGFAWRDGAMTELPTLGGPNGYASAANDRGQIVGWAETNVFDPTCEGPGPGKSGQLLQFLPVVYGPAAGTIRALPLLDGDSSGAATAINARGQVVGISGSCDQAVGRYTAAHAVSWDAAGHVTDIGAGVLTAPFWNTPTAINAHGDVVGFAGDASDPTAGITHAFVWTRAGGMQLLNPASNDNSTATGINARGQVVGYFVAGDGALHGFVWDAANGMQDLNGLRQAGYTQVLALANDIDDAGVIVGRTATNPANGVRSAFVMVPHR
jgi:probable HAF family extracellular repeat protein